VVAVAVLVALAPPAASAATKIFTQAGCQQWSVPAGAGDIDVLATGAAGRDPFVEVAGTGDGVTATLAPPLYGPTLDVCVDYGGGGSFYGGSGGGASGVSTNLNFSLPQVVAGGGGGSGYLSNGGGSAGLPAGSAGPGTSTGPFAAGGGAGGDNNGACGGAGGVGAFPGGDGSAFTSAGPGTGGVGGGAPAYGGGGGAGYCGGGGGGAPVVHGTSGGGGGGSDFCGGPPRVGSCMVLSGLGTGTTAGPYSGEASVVLAYGGSALPHPTATTLRCTGRAPVAACTATVTDVWPSPNRPAGTVRFSTKPLAAIVPPACSLRPATQANAASCQVFLLVAPNRFYEVTATYSGNSSHRPSVASEFVQT
jgi:hypothetical protein